MTDTTTTTQPKAKKSDKGKIESTKAKLRNLEMAAKEFKLRAKR